MTADEILRLARAGDLDALAADPQAVARAVREFAQARQASRALELVGRSWRIWFSIGELDEGSAVAADALAAPGAETVAVWRARVLYVDGLFAFRSGDQKRSQARNEEALRVARAADDVQGECEALTGLARVALRNGRYDEVVSLARGARERAQAAGDREAEAAPLHLQAAGTRLLEEYASARELYLESLDLNADLDDTTWVAMEQHNLGWVELHLGNIDDAEARFRARDAEGTDAYGDAWSNLNWAAVAFVGGNIEEAERRFAAGKDALERLGAALDPDDQSELDWLSEQLLPVNADLRTTE